MDITLERILSLIPSEKDGRFKKYERRSKYRVWVAFLVLVAINIAMLIFDLLNPYVGYIRYQRQMAAYTGETASVVLGIIIRKIKGATRILRGEWQRYPERRKSILRRLNWLRRANKNDGM